MIRYYYFCLSSVRSCGPARVMYCESSTGPTLRRPPRSGDASEYSGEVQALPLPRRALAPQDSAPPAPPARERTTSIGAQPPPSAHERAGESSVAPTPRSTPPSTPASTPRALTRARERARMPVLRIFCEHFRKKCVARGGKRGGGVVCRALIDLHAPLIREFVNS
jgi:hypothetical protein